MLQAVDGKWPKHSTKLLNVLRLMPNRCKNSVQKRALARAKKPAKPCTVYSWLIIQRFPQHRAKSFKFFYSLDTFLMHANCVWHMLKACKFSPDGFSIPRLYFAQHYLPPFPPSPLSSLKTAKRVADSFFMDADLTFHCNGVGSQ